MKTVLFEDSGNIGHIIFNRPQKRNAINDSMQKELVRLCSDLKGRSDLAVLILSGKGSSFIAGADLSAFAKFRDNPEHIKPFVRNGVEMVMGLYRLPQFTIAAIEGNALGGGLELALYTNYIIAGKDAKIGLPESGLGLIPGLGGAYLLERKIGAKGLEMALTGEIISGEKACRLGIIEETTDNRGALEKAIELAARIAKKPARATHLMKKHFLDFNPIDIEIISDDFQKLLTRSESQDRIHAFFKKKLEM